MTSVVELRDADPDVRTEQTDQQSIISRQLTAEPLHGGRYI